MPFALGNTNNVVHYNVTQSKLRPLGAASGMTRYSLYNDMLHVSKEAPPPYGRQGSHSFQSSVLQSAPSSHLGASSNVLKINENHESPGVPLTYLSCSKSNFSPLQNDSAESYCARQPSASMCAITMYRDEVWKCVSIAWPIDRTSGSRPPSYQKCGCCATTAGCLHAYNKRKHEKAQCRSM